MTHRLILIVAKRLSRCIFTQNLIGLVLSTVIESIDYMSFMMTLTFPTPSDVLKHLERRKCIANGCILISLTLTLLCQAEGDEKGSTIPLQHRCQSESHAVLGA